ncbi:type 2 periplasmic-binding domain-containing protein [Flavivirga rizhaonensis]|uniref:ABC transporter substrate-binding protein n=1 Tax=Flavivirga rizhaonensis TaxID=2559571 RepID=A0A4S1E2L4_9FLAO|nr:ABC transporter substrate-binding protein [Flavivirga rizhaonensis]TGV04830.1 hypothetical protein EM932_01540 [Flavivirga rizhaonensis]
MEIIKRTAFASLIVLLLLTGCKNDKEVLNVAISPYQDIAMIVNIDNLKLEEKYNINVNLMTMNWEDILPALSSAGKTADIGFGSYIEYLTKYPKLNKDTKDPVLFIYPAYIFKGGGFITYDSIQPFNRSNIDSLYLVNSFFGKKIGAQKNSVFEMMLYSLANRSNYDIAGAQIFDSPLNDAILATQNGSLDIAAAGLTQITEANKNGGKVILTMEDLGFADITGFICKKSTYDKRKEDIDNLIKMWFECVDYVFKDLEANSVRSLKYLDEKAATKYTFDQYKTALSQEYFPKSINEADTEILNEGGLFYYKQIQTEVIDYLKANEVIKEKYQAPDFVKIE